MASKTSCNACLRALRKQRQCRVTTILPPRRSFTKFPALKLSSSSFTGAPKSKKVLDTITQEIAGAVPITATEAYYAFGVTEKLYKECARQADYTIPQAGVKGQKVPKTAAGEDLGVGEGWWYGEVSLTPTFSTWAQITILHLHMMITRLRHFPPEVAPSWQQQLLDHFFYDAEHRMAIYHNMHARGTRNRYLKDLYVQYRGAIAAYDEGIARGDAVLATAVWRNVFAASEAVDLTHLATVVSYMRRAIARLAKTPDELLGENSFAFKSPEAETQVVDVRSRLMDEPFKEKGSEAGNGVTDKDKGGR